MIVAHIKQHYNSCKEIERKELYMDVLRVTDPVPKQNPINSKLTSGKELHRDAIQCGLICSDLLRKKLLQFSTNVSKRDELKKIVRSLKKQADQERLAKAQNDYGYMLATGSGLKKHYKMAREYFERKEAKSLPEALYNYGYMEENGLRGSKKNQAETKEPKLREACRLYRLAADQGLPEARNNLGRMYELGLGVGQDHAEACNWYRKAADQGHARAQCNLGVMYEEGHGVGQDYGEACRLYRLAADQGLLEARNNLGRMYKDGCGNAIEQSKVKARYWYHKAAEQGDRSAWEALRAMNAW